MSDGLTHFDADGKARMVDVGGKDVTRRVAVAAGEVIMASRTLEMVRKGTAAKGDVLGVARIAAIMAAKRVDRLIPLAHPLAIDGVDVEFRLDEEHSAVHIEARVSVTGRTGVEMEALSAVSAAALTIYDMCKAVDRSMVLNHIRLLHKSGGRSGDFNRKEAG